MLARDSNNIAFLSPIIRIESELQKKLVFRMGSAAKANAKNYSLNKLKWSDRISLLGIEITQDSENLLSANLEPLLIKAKTTLDLWKQRGLSLIGKINIVNTLVASIFIHRLAVLPCIPDRYAKQFNEMIQDFVWNGGKPKISMKILKGNKEDGGLGLIDLQMKDVALKAQWVLKAASSKIYKEIVKILLNNKIGTGLFEAQLHYKDIPVMCPLTNFWTDTLKCWCQLNYEKSISKAQVENLVLWYNSNIRIENKPVVYAT